VSREAGAPWAEKLLPRPEFLRHGPETAAPVAELRDALRLTGLFLDRDIFAPRGLKAPESRAAYLASL
jgi:DNA repair protein RecO (recombination protein O)